MHWFAISMCLLGTYLVLLAVPYVLRFRRRRVPVPFGPLTFHGFTAVSAVFVTKLGTVNGPVYSVDCIWFNGLMVLVYLIVWRIARRLAGPFP
jgi:hypothetical protein